MTTSTGGEVVGGEAQLPAEEAEGAADDMPADTNLRILAERNHDSPRLEESAKRLADGGAGLDGDRVLLSVEVDPLHRRDVDDDLHRRIGNESLEAVAAARHDESASFLDCLVHGRDHLIGRRDEPDVIGPRHESFVELFADDRAVARIVGRDLLNCACCSSFVCRVVIVYSGYQRRMARPEGAPRGVDGLGARYGRLSVSDDEIRNVPPGNRTSQASETVRMRLGVKGSFSPQCDGRRRNGSQTEG